MGLETDDAFLQRLILSGCVKILFNCLQNLEAKMKRIKEISLAVKDWQIKGSDQLNDMNKNHQFYQRKIRRI